MTQFITLMVKQDLKDPFEPLVEIRLNVLQIISLRDIGSQRVYLANEGIKNEFTSPIVEVRVPGAIFFASGVAEEIEARLR